MLFCFCNNAYSAAFNDGNIHNINYSVQAHVTVDFKTKGMHTTVNWFSGASTGDRNSLLGYEDSHINVYGGRIDYILYAFQRSEVNIYGGWIDRFLDATGSSRVSVYDGYINGDLLANNDSRVLFSGGTVNKDIEACHASRVTINGGTINGEIHAGRENWDYSSRIIIEGSNFSINGVSVNYGQYFATDFAGGHLTGTLANGDLLNNDFYIYGNSSIVLVAPEPATPVAHWAFDETSGRIAYDSVGDNHAVLFNGPTWTNGQINGALSFDGVDDYAIANWVCADIAWGSFSVTGWIKSEAVNPANQFIISFNTFYGDNRLLLGTQAGSSTLSIYDGTLYDTGVTVIDGGWHHIAYVVDDVADTITVYIDGVNVLGFSSTVSVATSDLFSLGQEYDDEVLTKGDFYDGLLDDVQIYDTALSGTDIQQLYDEGIVFLNISPSDGFASSGDIGGPFEPASKDYQLTNIRDTSIDWDVQYSAGWLDVSSTSGTLAPGASTTVTVSINSTANTLGWGKYADEVMFRNITDPLAIKAISRQISLEVNGPIIELSTDTINFSADEGGSNPAEQTLTITNIGGATLDWTIAESCDWLTVDPAWGSSMGEGNDVTLSVDTSGMNWGEYQCILTISDPQAENNPRTVSINLDINGSIIGLSSNSFSFGAEEGGANPAGQTLTITNTGIGTLDWTITGGCDWLSVSPVSGSSTGEGDDVTLSVDITGLAYGGYSCQLTVSDPLAENDPQVVTVGLGIGGTDLFVPSQYDTIQGAVDAAYNSDVILLADGVYTGWGNMGINYYGKAITVRSENGPANCIIDCSGYYGEVKGFTFKNGEGADSVLDGVTITGGNAGDGGGIRIAGASPTIRNCIFRDNTAEYGGGICLRRSHSMITNCVFNYNTAVERGGAIFAEGASNVIIEGCDLIGNSADVVGGGIRFQDGVSATILNSKIVNNSSEYDGHDGGVSANNCVQVSMSSCLVSGNFSEHGVGGLKINSDDTVITNCTVVNNTGGEGRAGALGGINLIVRNSLFAGNSMPLFEGSEGAFSYCYFDEDQEGDAAVAGLGGTEGNQIGDSKLTGSFYLQADSPCIDAGDPMGDHSGQIDIDGEERVYNGVVDIGADEFIDVDGDGLADRWEIEFFGSIENGIAGEDTDGDGKSNLEEYNNGTNPIESFYYVAVNGNDLWDGAAAQWDGLHGPKATIQAAIDICNDGDAVMIGDGTYTGEGNRDITFRGKAITVRSRNGAENCIIDCQSQSSYDERHRGFIFVDGEGADSVLKGVTITNGYANDGWIPFDRIQINSEDYGGGIFCAFSGPTIDRCVIKNCYAMRGSAIASRNDYYWEWPEAEAKSPVIKSCIITGNTSGYRGAIQLEYASGTVIENCSITENAIRNDNGYVIVFDNSYYSEEMDDIVIRNSIIYNNLLTDGQDIYQIGLLGQGLPLLVIENCDIEGGLGGIDNPYGRDIEWGEGNIDADPGFVQAGHWNLQDINHPYDKAWVEGDYHLGINSPCVNAGWPYGDHVGQTDIDGEERVMGGRVDIGADEFKVHEVPYLFVSPGRFVFDIYENEAESACQELRIYNGGVGGFNWEIVEDCPWLKADKAAGSVGEVSFETVKLSVLGSGLSVGSYPYQLVVSAAGAQNRQQVVEIVLNVKDPLSVPGEYRTIQGAVNEAYDGDIVLLADGVYTGDGNFNISYKGKAITVRSENGPVNCIIDCSGYYDEVKGFTFKNGEGADSVLDGVTITGGNAEYGDGGGIRISRASPTIKNCVFRENRAKYGGGVCLRFSNSVITDCVFSYNTAIKGGGIYATGNSNITVKGCDLEGNTASSGDGRGGGVYCEGAIEETVKIDLSDCEFTLNAAGAVGGAIRFQDRVSATVLNCKIVNNSSPRYDGGISIFECGAVEITNCLIAGNVSQSGAGGLKILADATTITNCTIAYNQNDEAGALSGENLIVRNTLFAGDSKTRFDAWHSTFSYCYFDEDLGYYPNEGNGNQVGDSKLTGDYHLQADSPCIDAGDSSAVTQGTDLDGNMRIVDGDGDGAGVVDIGAYEYAIVSRLIVSPKLFNFSAYHGQPEPISADVILTSDYPIEDLNWSVVEKDSLIEVSKMGGTVAAGGFDEVSVSIDVSELGVGYYASSLVIALESNPRDRHTVNIYFRIIDPVTVPGEYNTIQEAVDAAYYGDIVLLADGVYTGVGNMNINYRGKAITVKSENGPENCIIDCSEGGVETPGGFEAKGFTFKNGEGADSVLDGVTITNGIAGDGGGIRIAEGSFPVIKNCILLNNFARNNGGGIYCGQSPHMTIKDCKFINNETANRGGAIFAEGASNIIIKECDLVGNRSGLVGGGIRFQDGVSATALNCKIVNNSSEYDGGVSANACVRISMTNCLVSGNFSELGVGGLKINSDDTVITNCTVVNNTGGEGRAGALGGSYKGVINTLFAGNSMPLFDTWDSEFSYCYFEDQVGDSKLTDSFHLQADSPCIDAGDNSAVTEGTDLDGNARIVDGDGDGAAVVDIGAYEYFIPSATPATVKGEAIDILENAKVGGKVDKELEKAIKHIKKSLEKTFKGPGKHGEEQNVWIDDWHLDPKYGKKVFDEEKKAAKVLMDLMDGKEKKGRGRKGRGRKDNEDIPEEVKDACRAAIDKLIEADDMLASVAYDEALAGAGDPKVDKELDKCESEFEKAEKELDKGKYDKVIDHYKHAWEHAQHCL